MAAADPRIRPLILSRGGHMASQVGLFEVARDTKIRQRPSSRTHVSQQEPLAMPDARPLVGQEVIVRVVPMLSGRVATMVTQFLSLALIGRTLGPSAFGVLQVALVAFVYLNFLGDLGISILGTRDNDRLTTPGWVGTYIGARLVLGLVAVAVAAIASVLLDLRTRDAQIVAVLAVGLIASSLGLRWLLQARERFAHIALIDTAAAAVQLGSALALAAHGGGVLWAAATMASAPVVSALLTAMVMRGSLERPRIGAATMDLIRLALPAGVAVFATSLYFYIDTILLGIVRSPAEVGYYAAENPVEVYNLHATVLKLLGIDHKRLTYYHNGIQRRLTDVHGSVIEPILA